MSRAITFEQRVLAQALAILSNHSSDFHERMTIIEICASLYGNFDIHEYWKKFSIHVSAKQYKNIEQIARSLYDAINDSGVPVSLAIASLARKPIPIAEQKKNGAFYTDYRLASHIAKENRRHLFKGIKVADIAAGSGILLAGIANEYYQLFPDHFNRWISESLYAFDLSRDALRGAVASISCNTSSVNALHHMYSNWIVCDSLSEELDNIARFDLVIGNPPWGKVKLSKHLFSLENGIEHSYGDVYHNFDIERYNNAHEETLQYSQYLKEKFALLDTSETDLYMAFLIRALSLLNTDGYLSYIVPSSLIRSQGARKIREYITNNYSQIQFQLFDNHPLFFSIDSRFKFLIVSLRASKRKCNSVSISNYYASDKEITTGEIIELDLKSILRYRPDLTIPEVRTYEELNLFFKIYSHSSSSWMEKWGADIRREVDMTNDKPLFKNCCIEGCIPVIEGRMVQPYRLGAKSYISGSGRCAVWEPCSMGLKPQFYISEKDLSEPIKERIKQYRVGYCDIAGQTNERSMMATIIPPYVVCGNKVPTITFSDGNVDRLYLWLGFANSFVFDWLLRRVISTTVNYFLLSSIPIPNIDIQSEEAQIIIKNAKRLTSMGPEYYTSESMSIFRSEIDSIVCKLYGLDKKDVDVIFEDFPLIDRGQASINNEDKSTVTKDYLLSLYTAKNSIEYKKANRRKTQFVEECSKPYILFEMRGLTKQANMSQASIVIYKKIVAGDLRKFTATSNDTPSGGGARDLRFSPQNEFWPIFQRLFPTHSGRNLVGKFNWANGQTTDVTIGAPTNARPNEMRICSINECFVDSYIPRDANDCILILVQDDNGLVWPHFISEASLRTDPTWHPVIREVILNGLDAERRAGTTPMGFHDFVNNRTYTNGHNSE